MAVDFPQVRDQVKKLGESAREQEQMLQSNRDRARELLELHAGNLEKLREKVQRVAQEINKNLRCAIPVEAGLRPPEPLDGHFPASKMPAQAVVLAADGSQIAPDRHQPVRYCLINVGGICIRHGQPLPPAIQVESRLFYGDELYTPTGTLTESTLALRRDLHERQMLLNLAQGFTLSVISFTDGPMELWGPREIETQGEFRKSLAEYLDLLRKLAQLGVTTAGYVDNPSADLVVRMLEVAGAAESELPQLHTNHPLRGVTDKMLFREFLGPGERSAVFGLQSHSVEQYRDELALHFFYLNVGREGHSWLARVEIPAWVAADPVQLDLLHACLIDQCRILGARPYPYALHRAHEVAVVSLQEKDQVTEMIALELRRRGVEPGDKSNKQFHKDHPGRTSFRV